MRCLILAAGFGSRLQSKGASKPLIELDGTPLIERVMITNREAGVEAFDVVIGHRGEELRAHLDAFAADAGLDIRYIENPEYRLGNGVSVLQGRGLLNEPFILSMCDHIYESSVVADLIAVANDSQGLPGDGLVLAVDRNIDNPKIDLDDVTRVLEHDGYIRAIGKGIVDYNCFDTGVFVSTPGLFDAIERSIELHSDDTLSGGVRLLAAQRKARILDIGARYWIDVDEPFELDEVARRLSP
jgi:1L-myo-inositol 1-phosphate cytidylyltransferase